MDVCRHPLDLRHSGDTGSGYLCGCRWQRLCRRQHQPPDGHAACCVSADERGRHALLPEVCPEHYIHHCIAVRNKANGIYSNHHLGGCRWEQNTAWMNLANYNMVNRQSTEAEGCVDVPGYGHKLSGNVSWAYRDQSREAHLVMYDPARSSESNNTFSPGADGIEVTADMFESVNPREMFLPRRPDGSLPETGFLRPRPDSPLAQRRMGWTLP